jgi:Fic family protein
MDSYVSGRWEKTINGYTCFIPSFVNLPWRWDHPDINDGLEKAASRLGELNAFARLVPSIDLFIQLHVAKEAVVSSRIEGTQTRMDEALLDFEEVSPERRNDWLEVNNYIRAMNLAIEEMQTLPVASRLIRHAHAALLENVRGSHKLPGEYRRSQNWIGGSSPSNAVFVPPPADLLNDLMGDLENFLHREEDPIPSLIRIAIAHYQFETIHPFLDGNGRIGRLMIPLYLIDRGLLSRPLLYLSSYFERNRSAYYDRLMRVRTHNEIAEWILYFLQGVTEVATESVATLSKVLALKADIELQLASRFGRRTAVAFQWVQQMFRQPVFRVENVRQVTGLSFKASNDLIAEFVLAGFVTEMTGQSRNRIFRFEPYLDLFQGA